MVSVRAYQASKVYTLTDSDPCITCKLDISTHCSLAAKTYFKSSLLIILDLLEATLLSSFKRAVSCGLRSTSIRDINLTFY